MTAPKKIWIKMRGATVHRPGPQHAPRIDLISGCSVPSGHWDVLEIASGIAFEIPEDEGRRLLALHSGEEVPSL